MCPLITANQSAAKIMDLNGAENAFNMIEMELKAEGRANGWPKNKKELADRIGMTIKKKITKKWCRDTMSSLPSRWQEVIRREGQLTDYYCPKNNYFSNI